jgi:integrase
MHALSVEDAITLLKRMYSQGYEYGLATEFLLCTGLRLGEIAALEQSDVKGDHIMVSRAADTGARRGEQRDHLMLLKWGSGGRVPLPKVLAEKLRKFFEHNRRHGEQVWAFPFVHKMAKTYSRRLSKWSRKLGLPITTAHVLRRTAITWLVADGVPLAVVQAVARHSTSAMTEQYVDTRQITTDGATDGLARRLAAVF